MLRTTAYNKALKTVGANSLTIAVLYKAGDPNSTSVRNDILGALKAVQASTIQGLAIALMELSYSGADGLKQSISGQGIDVLYVCPGLGSSVLDIQQVSRAAGVRTITGVAAYIRDGLSIGAVSRESKAMLLINLRAAKAEGMKLNGSLLRLATVLK